ncbi:MAG TPA: type VII secretion integral membrane protein EccD [Stackebrandtia sp.]|uniref:type VII secretion integral membrane protein EccD n=1 Tax=Stackebrandtia sp. TaxID=2023065 RepID=UPI002D5B9EA6|nr:type VII secretion integral membrane protein EccD [Stackebrandtia sp.]HZE39125.1 type VII secretion integral membrane protein EccD [Stackebrandtia sp.]
MSLGTQQVRVTVVAPNTRMDVALPEHVRLCDLQSDLLDHAAAGPSGEELLDSSGTGDGWVLTRMGGAPLDARLTPRQLDIVDGEELYFTPADQAAPETVFDDVIDAVASANRSRGRKWTVAASRRFGIAVAVAALVGGAVAAAASGTTVARWTSVAMALACLCTALILARALGRTAEATVMGLVAGVYGAVGGALVLGRPSPFTAPSLMVAGAGLAVVLVAAGIGVPRSAPIFQSGAIAAAALTGAAALCVLADATVARAAATVATVALALIPAAPMLSFRVARLPMPSVPRSPQQLRTDTERVDGPTALIRSERADQHLTGILTAVAATLGAAAVALALDANLPALLLASLFTLLAFMRARVFVSVRQRLPFLLAATLGAAALAYCAWTNNPDPTTRLTLLLGALVLVAAAALGFVLGIAGKPIAPTWGRLVDIAEVTLFVAVVPLTLWVWDAYWWVRTLNG